MTNYDGILLNMTKDVSYKEHLSKIRLLFEKGLREYYIKSISLHNYHKT